MNERLIVHSPSIDANHFSSPVRVGVLETLLCTGKCQQLVRIPIGRMIVEQPENFLVGHLGFPTVAMLGILEKGCPDLVYALVATHRLVLLAVRIRIELGLEFGDAFGEPVVVFLKDCNLLVHPRVVLANVFFVITEIFMDEVLRYETGFQIQTRL
ncbi:hypothetical protein HAPAU_33390 [Halalkalicoccus paucihalophilus]|uniref:Uncharacterized protein n=1 Tax=Halalkalicoccus paucihalophilus TaxID=1008153 RepID=A0A151A9H3_9EURY|nr:hypothetical protein [Halalkalicoccus paucihalophilus]KYH24356.1 hypothetical protein HAPAU_33390 [Halalkalicoccus paucihalophilus]